MRFEWDEEKNRQNRNKHGVSFETAALVFDDPYALTKRDAAHDEDERFITLGATGLGVMLVVVHISFASTGSEEVIRIISARPATSRERKTYEETHKAAETRNRRHRSKERRRH